jgi:hypothetical protein
VSSLAPIPATDLGSERHRTIAEQLSDPAVLIEYRPGACRTQAQEVFGGPDRRELGPLPTDVIRSVCRTLQREPVRLLCDSDPKNANGCYIADEMGVPLCRLTGMTPDQTNDALLSLAIGGWIPGDRDHVDLTPRSALDLMPATAMPAPPQGKLL